MAAEVVIKTRSDTSGFQALDQAQQKMILDQQRAVAELKKYELQIKSTELQLERLAKTATATYSKQTAEIQKANRAANEAIAKHVENFKKSPAGYGQSTGLRIDAGDRRLLAAHPELRNLALFSQQIQTEVKRAEAAMILKPMRAARLDSFNADMKLTVDGLKRMGAELKTIEGVTKLRNLGDKSLLKIMDPAELARLKQAKSEIVAIGNEIKKMLATDAGKKITREAEALYKKDRRINRLNREGVDTTGMDDDDIEFQWYLRSERRRAEKRANRPPVDSFETTGVLPVNQRATLVPPINNPGLFGGAFNGLDSRLMTSIMGPLAAMLSIQAVTGFIKDAHQKDLQERDAAGDRIVGALDPLSTLKQISHSPQDLQKNLEFTNRLRVVTGMDLGAAAGVTFSAKSAGIGMSADELGALTRFGVNPETAIRGIATMRTNFGAAAGTDNQIIAQILNAARPSPRANFDNLLQAIAESAQAFNTVGSTTGQQAAMLSAFSDALPDTSEAATAGGQLMNQLSQKRDRIKFANGKTFGDLLKSGSKMDTLDLLDSIINGKSKLTDESGNPQAPYQFFDEIRAKKGFDLYRLNAARIRSLANETDAIKAGPATPAIVSAMTGEEPVLLSAARLKKQRDAELQTVQESGTPASNLARAYTAAKWINMEKNDTAPVIKYFSLGLDYARRGLDGDLDKMDIDFFNGDMTDPAIQREYWRQKAKLNGSPSGNKAWLKTLMADKNPVAEDHPYIFKGWNQFFTGKNPTRSLTPAEAKIRLDTYQEMFDGIGVQEKASAQSPQKFSGNSYTTMADYISNNTGTMQADQSNIVDSLLKKSGYEKDSRQGRIITDILMGRMNTRDAQRNWGISQLNDPGNASSAFNKYLTGADKEVSDKLYKSDMATFNKSLEDLTYSSEHGDPGERAIAKRRLKTLKAARREAMSDGVIDREEASGLANMAEGKLTDGMTKLVDAIGQLIAPVKTIAGSLQSGENVPKSSNKAPVGDNTDSSPSVRKRKLSF